MLRRSCRVLARFQSTITKTKPETAKIEPHVFEGVDQTKYLETQAPNRVETWAEDQRPRSEAMTGVRFDGKDLSMQPQPYAAVELIAKVPVRFVHHVAVCDGNASGKHGGVQGHPKLYINVDKPGVHACQYCGDRYADEHYREQIEAAWPNVGSGFGP